MELPLKGRMLEMKGTKLVAIKWINNKIYTHTAHQRIHICILYLDTFNNQLEVIECKIHMVYAMDAQKWRNLLPKHGSRKFAANVDLVVAILHRKMIEKGKC
ncbi:hypothetical protein A2U01_0054785 [Trifolium medium]|uniref:Uncharacterized protein n=1 Tax=Trifolium medium TaxID=97028 RepID=A0A392RAA1_9FABA|nr:hypothetical protein [Trifolium medium]